MSLSRRDRREWRIFLWISLSSAVISAYFGYAIAPDAIPQPQATRRRPIQCSFGDKKA